MSTHDWWLQLTMYQPRYSRSSTPGTSHRARCVSRIQPLLQAIQLVAIAFSTGSIAARTRFAGRTSLTSEHAKRRAHQNSVLTTSSVSGDDATDDRWEKAQHRLPLAALADPPVPVPSPRVRTQPAATVWPPAAACIARSTMSFVSARTHSLSVATVWARSLTSA